MAPRREADSAIAANFLIFNAVHWSGIAIGLWLMNAMVQKMLLGLYRCVNSTGLLQSKPGRRAFEWGYLSYKRWLEAGPVNSLRSFIPVGTTVFDVGANVGFFTLLFARFVGPQGRVIAIEPEPRNVERLRERIDRNSSAASVEVIAGVAADRSGELHLQINPDHPADHRLSDQGLLVTAVTLDECAAAHGWPEISLIKIDVQGAEWKVLQGAREIIQRFHPTLLLELDDEALKRQGSSAEQLLEHVVQAGYSLRPFHDSSAPNGMSNQEIMDYCQSASYQDLLCLHRSNL